ncbi:H-type small acid-soluble spore protein [Bacillus sp. FJAT-49736]|uniref:H-type small acid-soluble spore protein n=1 Tax=Bacillus sp. FJAT-49736 TaxID=2833582 RepID=UPI001BC94397|nr:H-type small acid-soluble spore protein [Bacillus sp. FJAT-49736]MBS4173073.1 H-type small acid-soluble spore protein [Bacillus sp. FJAT-49736]
MDTKRIKQILSTSAEIEVKYHGQSVWIDEFHEGDGLATVHLRGPLEERSQVAVADLVEE